MPRLSALVLAAALVAGCGSDAPPAGVTARAPEPVDSTALPSTSATTTTAAVPPSSTGPVTSAPPATSVEASAARAVISPRGVVVPVVAPLSGGAWQVRTPCNAVATLTGGQPLAGATVVLDPGHGGREPGAVSPSGMSEAPVNLEVSRYAKSALEHAGVSVVLTRTGDYDVSLSARAEIAKALSPRAFVSVHHNAEPDGPWPRPGSETYYQINSPSSKRLAGLLFEEVVRALSVYSASWVADTDAGAKYRPGSKGDYYAMLRLPAPVVSALSEAAFISNPTEALLLARADVQKAEGDAIARAILRYLNTPDPGSGFVEPYPRQDPPGSGTPPPCVETAL